MSKIDGETPPVFKLGACILSLVFAESARKEDVIRLTLVCSFFRDILQRLPRLFSAICITTRPQHLKPPGSVFGLHFYSIRSSSRLSTLLKRAMNTPLEIMIDFPVFFDDDESHQKKQKMEALSMLTTLCRHSDRWETLEVNSVGLFRLDELGLQEVLPGPLEKLKRLSLCNYFQPLVESMKRWLPQIHVLYVQPPEEGQLETLLEAPWLSGIHDLTLKYDSGTVITSSTRKLLHACPALCSLHIYGAYGKESSFGAITLNSLTELTLSFRSFRSLSSSLQTPALTSLTINEGVCFGDVDPHYPCLKRLSVTTNEPWRIFHRLPVLLYDSLFFNFLGSNIETFLIGRLVSIKARTVTIHHARSSEAAFISMLETMSGVLEELELVDVSVGSKLIDLFSSRDQCVRTVREFRFRNQQYQRWIWTPSAGWAFLGM